MKTLRALAPVLALAFALAALLPLAGSADLVAPVRPAPDGAAPDPKVERGRYLVTIGGCNDCHTPWHVTPDGPEPDWSRMLSGHPQALEMPPAPKLPDGPWVGSMAGTNTAWAGPWGVSFTANLTPDPETGTGRWTEQQFIDTLRSGRHLGRGRQLLPPMPWFNYGQMTDEDLSAVWAYLQSIPPIENRVPEPLPPIPAH